MKRVVSARISYVEETLYDTFCSLTSSKDRYSIIVEVPDFMLEGSELSSLDTFISSYEPGGAK